VQDTTQSVHVDAVFRSLLWELVHVPEAERHAAFSGAGSSRRRRRDARFALPLGRERTILHLGGSSVVTGSPIEHVHGWPTIPERSVPEDKHGQ
jgi:hypothetical protein